LHGIGCRRMGPGVGRFGLAALLLIAALTCASIPAAANPITDAGPVDLTEAPFLLLIVNYPINGCMLLLCYNRVMGKRRVALPLGEMAIIFDLTFTVLLFSMLGVSIDTVVALSTHEGGPVAIVLPIGLLGIAVSCQLTAQRYLRLGGREALPCTALVTFVNLVSWTALDAISPEGFLVVYPLVVGIWVAFDVLLLRTTMRLSLGAPKPEPSARRGDLMETGDAEKEFIHPAAIRGEMSRRNELVLMTFVALLAALWIAGA